MYFLTLYSLTCNTRSYFFVHVLKINLLYNKKCPIGGGETFFVSSFFPLHCFQEGFLQSTVSFGGKKKKTLVLCTYMYTLTFGTFYIFFCVTFQTRQCSLNSSIWTSLTQNATLHVCGDALRQHVYMQQLWILQWRMFTSLVKYANLRMYDFKVEYEREKKGTHNFQMISVKFAWPSLILSTCGNVLLKCKHYIKLKMCIWGFSSYSD